MKTVILSLLLLCLMQRSFGKETQTTVKDTVGVSKMISRTGINLGIPPQTNNGSLKVTLGMNLVRMIDYDVDTNIVTAMAWPIIDWKSHYALWDQDDFGGVKAIRYAASEMWKPDITLYNSVYAKMDFGDVNTVITNDGQILWVPPLRMSFPCTPLYEGVYNCSAKFGSWTFSGDEIDLKPSNFDLSNLSENPRLAVSEAKMEKHVKYYPCCEEPYPSITFSWKLSTKKTKTNSL